MAENETKLAYRLRQLMPVEREQLLELLGMGRTTFYARLNNTGTLTLDEASIVCRFLEALDGEDLDLFRMLEPVNLRA